MRKATRAWIGGAIGAVVGVGWLIADYWPSHGVVTFDDGHYEGELIGDSPEGQGVVVFADGGRQEGEFSTFYRDGVDLTLLHGKGVSIFPDGERHEGEFHEGDLRQGFIVSADGIRTEGTYAVADSGQVVGLVEGVKAFPQGERQEGTYILVEFGGESVSVLHEGSWTYPDESSEGEFITDEGEFITVELDGEPFTVLHGQGTRTFPDGTRQEGRFDHDEYVGK